MQKIILAVIAFLLAAGALVVFFVFNPSTGQNGVQEQEPEQQETGGINRAYLEGLKDRHPRGEEYVQDILASLAEVEDEKKENYLSAFLNIAANLNLLKEQEEALRWYGQALSLDGDNVVALNNIANIYDEMGRYEDSEKAWLVLIEAHPERVPSWRSLGYLYRYRLNKSPEEIEAFFQQGLEATNNHPDLITWLISYFQEIGDNERFAKYANLLNASSQSQ